MPHEATCTFDMSEHAGCFASKHACLESGGRLPTSKAGYNGAQDVQQKQHPGHNNVIT